MTDVTGMVFVIRKHLHRESGKMRRRNMFSKLEIDRAVELAERYSEQNGEDFLVVQVIVEASKKSAKAPKAKAAQ